MQGHRSRHGDHVGLVVHVAGRLVGLADTDKAVKGTSHVVGEGGFVDLELVAGVGHRQLAGRHGHHAAAAFEVASPAVRRTGVIFHTGCHGHGVVLVVHAAGRLIALADADEPSKGVKHGVGLGHGAGGSPPIRVTAKSVFFVVGGKLIVLVGDAHCGEGRRVGIVVGHEGHGRHVPLVVHLAGRLVGLADADETDEGTGHVIREGGSPDLHDRCCSSGRSSRLRRRPGLWGQNAH